MWIKLECASAELYIYIYIYVCVHTHIVIDYIGKDRCNQYTTENNFSSIPPQAGHINHQAWNT